MKTLLALILLVANFSLDEIIYDIYNAATELTNVEYEQLQTDLYALHETPIDLNHATQEELEQLVFLTPRQVDDIMMYILRHPMDSLYELQLIPSLESYDIRNMLPFVTISHDRSWISENNKMYAREVFAYAKHEIVTRVDARNIEGFEGTDPMYAQLRYRFDYQRRVTFGAQLRRPAGGTAKDLQYGAYLQLKDIGHLHTLVAGNFQASFGHGLVFASPFHSGKSMYISAVGQKKEGLKYYSSVDGGGLHGAGATMRWNWGPATRLDASALYSMKRANDSTWQHVIGANLTLRHKQLQVELTAAENLWSDSIRPYRDAAYNMHYFRGFRQFVGGASARYNFGLAELFGEVATSENYERLAVSGERLADSPKWGVGTLVGSRIYPTKGVTLVALYRYYSPYFDNALGYGFSETSRLGDENGGYVGIDISGLNKWRFSGYADVFYFSGPKYGIPQSGTIGYDAVAEVRYTGKTVSRDTGYWTAFRLRARKKGDLSTYSARGQFDWHSGGWSLRTTAEANMTREDGLPVTGYGVTVYQDIGYTFSSVPLALRGRAQFFDAREWNNRIYTYEHDVLYAFSIPATYGLGGRFYACLKWQIIPQLALYLRVSETIYERKWAAAHKKEPTRTDVHLLLRATL